MGVRRAGVVFLTTMLTAAAFTAFSNVPARALHREELLSDPTLQEKCTLCHSSHRAFHMDPEKAKDVVARMQKMNPDWITDVEMGHILTVLTDVLKDPTIIAERKAWSEAVARGRDLFNDRSLGTTGKSCADCHKEDDLRKAADEYPRYEPEERRLVSLSQKINKMITDEMKGKAIEPNSQELIDLKAYLHSLR